MKAAYRTLLCQLFALFLALPPAFAEEPPLAEVPLFSQAELEMRLRHMAAEFQGRAQCKRSIFSLQ